MKNRPAYRGFALSKLHVVTGATGLLGSHVVEQLVERGQRVRALVRAGSDTQFLHSLGVELATVAFNKPGTLHTALAGADLVYHCAARVGDWGPWRVFRESVIDTAATVLDACRHVGVCRVLYVSSIMVYGHPRPPAGEKVTEDFPLGQSRWWWDYYCDAKIQAEQLCLRYPGEWTIVRPCWIYGPRDRNTLPRVFKALRAGRAAIVGTGDNLLNCIYARDAADGVLRAAHHPGAVGRIYNLCSEGEISQRDFLNALTDALGRKRVRRRFPYWLAFAGGFLGEVIGRIIRLKRPPHITRYAVALISRPACYSIDRARKELGWQPRMPPLEGMRQSLEWYFTQEPAARPPTAPVAVS